MKPFTGEIVIDASVETVFDVVADERNEPRYNPRMLEARKLTSGPVGRGARFTALMRTRGRPMPMTIEFTGFDRPHSLTSVNRMRAMEIEGTLTFTPVADGTRLHWSWALHPRGPLRLLGPLMGAIGRRQERANWTGLKNYLEGRK
jgi:uncharacterized protein YndB with AHSA1/START domain